MSEMEPKKFTSILALEENSSEVFMESTEVLIKIADNILKEPANPKFRSISLGSKIVTNKLLPAFGAMECLFEMGFQEGVDKLILPQGSSLESLKYIHSELLKRRTKRTSCSLPEPVSNSKKSVDNESTSQVAKDLIEFSKQITDSFLKKIIFWCFYVLKYENYELQLKALKLVPIVELNLNVMKSIRNFQLEFKKNNIKDEVIDYQELLLAEACNWFNNEFFTWVDSPKCSKCNFSETVFAGMSSQKFTGADRVEKYKCQKCNETVLFPRYSDPDKLLQTRKGRCGEWANCFCLFARALGLDARLVFDETDHVWIEFYSFVKSKWIHCDPCENAVDTPLMYECGWKKKLSYVIAYSKDEIQDVTWRYSCKHSEVLKNRKKCSEQDLVDFLIKVRNVMLNRASPARRNFVLKRTVLELVDLMKQNSASEAEEKGRISGSLAWRLLRGETTNEDDFKPYVWKVQAEDEKNKKFVLSYITSKDEYLQNYKSVGRNWRDGLFSLKSVFRKEEKDWKMVYLARKENSDRGILSWKFDTGEQLAIGTISLKIFQQTFETGMITCKLCSEKSCVFVPSGRYCSYSRKELRRKLFGEAKANDVSSIGKNKEGEKETVTKLKINTDAAATKRRKVISFTLRNINLLRVEPPNTDNKPFLTDAFMGSKTVELIVEMFGGSGPTAWQHAQILRQSLNSEEPTFNIILNLVQV